MTILQNIVATYPLHVIYLALYAAALAIALATIVWPIGKGRARLGALLVFLAMLALVEVVFALGYDALGGFARQRETGAMALLLLGGAGLLFAPQVNSRNPALLPLILLLAQLGFLMLYRLSLSESQIVSGEFPKQVVFTGMGLILLFLTIRLVKLVFLLDVHGERFAMLPLSRLNKLLGQALNAAIMRWHFSYHAWLFVTLLLLALPLLLGSDMRISLGAVQVQPSEFVKITFVIYLTHHLTRYRQHIGAWDEPVSRRIGFLLPPLITLSLPFFGYVLQRDFGPLMLYSLLLLCMFFVGTSRLLEVGVLLLVFIATIVVYNQFSPLVNALVPKYASIIVDRINIWQNPWLYTKGEQIVRALWAIKAAGLWGTGFGMGHPEFFPSEVQHDFIFILMTHELGTAGGLLVVLTYLLLFLQGIRIAFATQYDAAWNQEWAWFRLRLALGCTLILFFQALINIGGVINFSLLTGITLPYVSYGGTSLLVSYILAGILTFCSLTKTQV